MKNKEIREANDTLYKLSGDEKERERERELYFLRKKSIGLDISNII